MNIYKLDHSKNYKLFKEDDEFVTQVDEFLKQIQDSVKFVKEREGPLSKALSVFENAAKDPVAVQEFFAKKENSTLMVDSLKRLGINKEQIESSLVDI